MTRDAAITALVDKWRKEADTWQSGIGDNQNTRLYRECAQELADTLSALGGRPETGWHPIAGADKDPMAGILGGAHTKAYGWMWGKARFIPPNKAFPDGYWVTDNGLEPTHYLPLPSPPRQEQP